MRRWVSMLTTNQRLAAAALALGCLAVFAQPLPGASVRVDTRTLALIVQREVDHVSTLDLADWIVAGRSDFRLIDLRDANAYAEYHIPGAEHVEVTGLADAPLARNERVVLYSDGGIHAAQAWFLLKARGYQGVYTLRGGLDAWRDEILFPELAADPAPAQAAHQEKLAALARHFGGEPRTPGGPAGGAPVVRALPKVEMPTGGAITAAPRKKKKKEGC